jgi:hypothetical protein
VSDPYLLYLANKNIFKLKKHNMQVSKYKFGKPERATTNGQCRDTGNIGYKTHNQNKQYKKYNTEN